MKGLGFEMLENRTSGLLLTHNSHFDVQVAGHLYGSECWFFRRN